jgi:hypothetical protein
LDDWTNEFVNNLFNSSGMPSWMWMFQSVICMDVLYGYECDVVYRYDVMNYIVYGYGVITILCMDMMKYILYECDTYILHKCDEVYSVWM